MGVFQELAAMELTRERPIDFAAGEVEAGEIAIVRKAGGLELMGRRSHLPVGRLRLQEFRQDRQRRLEGRGALLGQLVDRLSHAVLFETAQHELGNAADRSRARAWASIRSGSTCVQPALAKVELDAPNATKICAMRISSVSRSITTAGVIDKQPLAGSVRLPHRHRQCLLEGKIKLAEPRVAVAAWVRGDVFVPQDQQGDP